MKIDSVEFVRSAVGVRDLPRDRLPELAMVGRSNVGKSSLINALVRTQVARTSGAPGKTRLLNVYRVVTRPTGPFYLVDLPGYGYARKKDARDEFDRLVALYFARAAGQAQGVVSLSNHGSPEVEAIDIRPAGPPDARTTAVGTVAVLLLVDARHPGLESDAATAGWLRGRGFAPLVVVTKVDKLSKSERAAALRAFEQHLGVVAPAGDRGDRVFGHAVVGVSAATGEGMDELWKQVTSWITAATGSSQPPSRP